MRIHCPLPFLRKLKSVGRPARFLLFLREKFVVRRQLKRFRKNRNCSLAQESIHLAAVTLVHGRFDTKSFRYKVVSIQNTILERTQTSVVNKANPYLREPPHVSKLSTQWEHVNETKFWFGLFIENRDLYK